MVTQLIKKNKFEEVLLGALERSGADPKAKPSFVEFVACFGKKITLRTLFLGNDPVLGSQSVERFKKVYPFHYGAFERLPEMFPEGSNMTPNEAYARLLRVFRYMRPEEWANGEKKEKNLLKQYGR